MAIVKSPNTTYTGTVYGVTFANGEGQTADPWTLEVLRGAGYTVVPLPPAETEPPKTGSKADLQAQATALGLQVDGLTVAQLQEAIAAATPQE